MNITWQSRSESDTVALGEALGRAIEPGDVVTLHGALGAGKTCLVRGIAVGMGIDPGVVSSPTFVVVNEYTGDGPPLVHVDAYRLGGPDDLDTIGWDEVNDGRAAVVVEWAERIEGALDETAPTAHVRLTPIGPESRQVELTAPAAWANRPNWRGVLEVTGAPLPPGWVRCPTTGRPVHPESPTFPFFDQRARMADLGKWISGSYVVSRQVGEEDLADPDLEPGR